MTTRRLFLAKPAGLAGFTLPAAVYTPALFGKAVSDRKGWIESAQQELAQRGHHDPNLITYCENLFSDYGSTHSPRRAVASDLHA